jgi:hypothetical protein
MLMWRQPVELDVERDGLSLLLLEGVPTVFGKAAVTRQELVNWSHRAQIVLPPTQPTVFDFKLIHLDSLLAAIERGAHGGDDGHALRAAKALVESDAECNRILARRVRADDFLAARHYLGQRGARAWEARLRLAMAGNELVIGSIDTRHRAHEPLGENGAAARLERHMALVLDALVRAGVDPQRLPAFRLGMPDPSKALVRGSLTEVEIDTRSLDRTWRYLLQSGLIRRR